MLRVTGLAGLVKPAITTEMFVEAGMMLLPDTKHDKFRLITLLVVFSRQPTTEALPTLSVTLHVGGSVMTISLVK